MLHPEMDGSNHTTHYVSRYHTEFEHEQCIGRGGFGVVFQAKNKVDDQRYAVKRIKLKHSDRAKVMREVRALAKLEHANIVRYYQAWLEQPPPDWQQQEVEHTASCPSTYTASTSSSRRAASDSQDNNTDRAGAVLSEDKQYLYIQMQLCELETLKEWLQKNILNRCSCHLMDVFYQTVDAVGYVHQSGLMHRDLKPSNIFFSPDGRVKVGDFGLATTLDEQTDGSLCHQGYCEHTAHVGTTLYMSPEQIEKRTYSYKVDIYSLGLILVELFCPFSTEMERVQTLTDAKKHKFAPHLNKSINNDIGFLLKLLSRDPENRPTAIEILNHKFSCQFTAKQLYLEKQKSGEWIDYISRYKREYEHKQELGKGDNGTVLEARCKLDGKMYAVKRISLFGFLDHDWEEGQIGHIEKLRKLSHPHICNYHQAWYDHPPPGWTKTDPKDEDLIERLSYTLVTLIVHYLHIQTELCNKYTLKHWMSDNTARNKVQILHMFYQIVAAVQYIHKSSLIHGNLKPSNILFGLSGGIKIGDFCLLKMLTGKQGVYVQQQATPRNDYNFLDLVKEEEFQPFILYMGPEQLSGRPFGNKVDVFAVGMILYEMLHVFNSESDRIHQLAGIRPDVTPRKLPLCNSTDLCSEYELIKSIINYKPEERISCGDILEGPLIQGFLNSQPQVTKIQ